MFSSTDSSGASYRLSVASSRTVSAIVQASIVLPMMVVTSALNVPTIRFAEIGVPHCLR